MTIRTTTDGFTKKFWSKVIKTDGCWKWRGNITMHMGYGWFNYKGYFSAHRASWLIHHGSIPKGKSVLHHCDNPPCTNPDHLHLGNQSMNMKEAWQRKRIRRHLMSGSKGLRDADKILIAMLVLVGLKQSTVAGVYRVSRQRINQILLEVDRRLRVKKSKNKP